MSSSESMSTRQRGKGKRGKKGKKKSKSQLKQEKLAAASQTAATKITPKEDLPAYLEAQREGSFKTYAKDVHIPNFTLPRPGGGKELLAGTDIQLTYGRKYGLIGRNGFGKSTLLKEIASYRIPEFPKHLRVLHVKQEMPGDETTVIQCVLRADEERTLLKKEECDIVQRQKDDAAELDDADRLHEIYERLHQIDADSAPARAATVLSGLEFTEEMQQVPTKDLSGGWRMRVSLASALFVEPDILLLDEPTNHLDFPAVEWLTNYLGAYEKTLVVVSHDKKFLNDVCTDIIHIEDSKLKYYKGNYDGFERIREEHRKQARTAYDKQQATIAHNEDFIRRFKANKKLSSLAQSRVKLLNHMEKLDAVKDDFQFRFRFPEPGPLKKDVLMSADEMAFGYQGEEEKSFLFSNVSLKLKVGTVAGVLGANGAGKSTLINVMLGNLEPVNGKVVLNNSASVGYFAQHHMENLDLNATPYEYLKAQFPEAKHQEIYQKLGQFNLTKTCANQKIGLLSGGEKSRVSFCVLTWHHPHLLVMDEPTNHLDLDTIEGLIGAIQDYQGGGVVLISHDAHFLESVCNEFWSIGGNQRVIKTFASLGDAKKFSYAKRSTITVGRQQSNLEATIGKVIGEQVASATFPSTNAKIDADCCNTDSSSSTTSRRVTRKSKKKTKKAMFDFDAEQDNQRLVESAVHGGKTPAQIYRIVQSLTPDPKTTLVAKCLSDRLFLEHFAAVPLSTSVLVQWAPVIQHMIPAAHKNNQMVLLFTAQSVWDSLNPSDKKTGGKLKGKSDGTIKDTWTPESILETFRMLHKLDMVAVASFKAWMRDTANKARGKDAALVEVEDWVKSI